MEEILQRILSPYSEKEREAIKAAYTVVENAMDGKFRENRHPFIEHPLGVADIVANEIGLDFESVIAVFIHEALRFAPELQEKLPKDKYSQEIIDIALSLNKIAAIKPKETRLEAENYKRLIISYSKDPRVTLIKLADRLDVMRNIELLPKSSQERKITETMFLYIPIAHQLGLYKLKSELENIFFKYTDPEHYREITNKLAATENERKELCTSFIEPLKKKIAATGLKTTFKQRTKSAYSIWKKMKAQNIPFEKVKDLLAIRIIIDTEPIKEKEHELCWKVYSIVTEEYIPDTSRMRDWLTCPKANGYESLHTTVADKNGHVVEVQIRTTRMDIAAEKGSAAHWSYKGIKEEKAMTEWLNSVRTVLNSENKIEYQSPSKFIKEEVFVFTPNGELRRLPKGATVLDFAFNIHTNIGIKCCGAIVDGKAVSIKEKLVTGQVVEILTNKNQKPSPDWYNIVVTSKARSRIKIKLKEEANAKANAGKELLERRLKNWKLVLTDEDIEDLKKIYKIKAVNDLFAAIEDEEIDPIEIKKFLATKKEREENKEKQEEDNHVENKEEKHVNEDYLIIDNSLNNVSYKMAKCCNPIYGDEIFGFVTVKDGIKIHRISCPNAATLIKKYPYRIQKVKWKKDVNDGRFRTTIRVFIEDTTVYSALVNYISQTNANLRSSSITPRGDHYPGEYDVRLHLLISSHNALDKTISHIRKMKGVISASRLSK